ncbi:MAG TPA: biopolymer transporter ExbD, partial [Cytophagaceae bacterium]|nr:biopolymer transporter ExbD [Cytophagaceae bacterium]
MAEISTGEGGKNNKKRAKKVSTKIDMTPMVDLAFLLITFFMFTTSLTQPQAMELNMPYTKDNKTTKLRQDLALTIILGEGNKVFWYTGIENPKVETTDYSSGGIREVLKEKKQQIAGLVVVIKAVETSRYKNLVDIIDEMHIVG